MSFKTKFTAATVAISLALAGTGCSSSGGFSLGGSDSNVNPELKRMSLHSSQNQERLPVPVVLP